MRAHLLLAVFLSTVQCCACTPKPKPVLAPVVIQLPPIAIPDPRPSVSTAASRPGAGAPSCTRPRG